ncbi:unnamed protein product [Brassica rapa subsp. trilocularis]
MPSCFLKCPFSRSASPKVLSCFSRIPSLSQVVAQSPVGFLLCYGGISSSV